MKLHWFQAEVTLQKMTKTKFTNSYIYIYIYY